MTTRILSMDGGMTGYVTMEVLRRTAEQINREGMHFLNEADILTGTSAGGLNALFLAIHDDPNQAIEDAQDFWDQILAASGRLKPGRIVTGMMGGRALDGRDGMRTFLIDYFGSETRLGDLKRKVIVPAFQLHNEHYEKENRFWRPRLFHNIPGITDYSPDELVVDVALRTTNIPIVSPIFSSIKGGDIGYLDGGLVANNPSMCAISAVFEERRAAGRDLGLDTIDVLSVSCGRKPLSVKPEMKDGIADWGYGQWLLAPKEPMLLVRLAIRGGTSMIDYQCTQLLGDHYKRVDPIFSESPHPFDVKALKNLIRQVLESQQMEGLIEDTCAWLHNSKWIDPPIDATNVHTLSKRQGSE